MKTNTKGYLWIAFLFFFSFSLAQNNSVTIGSNEINNKAVLWLVPNGGGGQGLLLPSITSVARTAMNMQTTDAGMVVFDNNDNKLYFWDGTTWISLVNSSNTPVNLSGDVTGATNTAVVAAIQGRNVGNIQPTANQALVWNATANQWQPTTIAGTALTQTADGKLNVNVGTSANQIPQLDANGKLPATTETDPTLKTVNGIVKSNGTTLSAAGASDINTTLGAQAANNFYAAPSGGNGFPSFRAITPTDVPTLNQNTTGIASNITATSNSTLTTLSALSLPTTQLSGTISNAQLANSSFNIGTTSINLGRASAAQALTGITSIDGSAARLTTGRIINIDLSTTATQNFNGSQDITTGVTGTLPITGGGTGANTVPNAQTSLGILTTANTIPKGNGTAQTASQIFDNGTNVGIGTTTPQEKLDVKGAMLLEKLTTVPTAIADRLYNKGDTLFWNGNNLSANGWSLTGNNGLTDGTNNFVGTIDTTPLNFMVNSQKSGRIDGFNSLLFLGYQAGMSNTGTSNTGVGNHALTNNSSGNLNTAIGAEALSSNTVGIGNTSVGSLVLQNNTTGNYNIAIGQGALGSNQTGSNNAALGSFADVTTDGLTNATAIGANAAVGASNSLVLGSISGVNSATANTNVGIGTTTPHAPLQFSNDVANRKIVLSETTNNDHQFLGLGVNTNTMRFQTPDYGTGAFAFYGGVNASTSAEMMRVQGGFTAIGGLSDTPLESGSLFEIQSDAGSNLNGMNIDIEDPNGQPYYGYATEGSVKMRTYLDGNNQSWKLQNSSSSDIFTVTQSGNVGIGTTTPTQAKLVVNGTQSYSSAATYSLYIPSSIVGPTIPGSAVNTNLSIYANAYIGAAFGFLAQSDARIKHVLGQSKTDEDLATISKIKITDYKYIDSLAQGNRVVKKVIAQELKEVYPNAVRYTTDFVPDVYKHAQMNNGYVAVKNYLKTGDKVKLFIDGKEEKIYTVKQVDENGFKVDDNLSSSVFVYGKEVNDFHNVDYEALSTLNISATQELLKLIKQQQTQIEELKATNKKMEDRLAAIEALLQNGNGQPDSGKNTTVKVSVK